MRVAAVRDDYQACRYDSARDRLVALLPAVAAARTHLSGDERCQLDVLATDIADPVAVGTSAPGWSRLAFASCP
jgi:hypothetical protein